MGQSREGFVFVEEDKKQTNNWAPAMQIMSEISTWIVGPIVLALIAGKWLDSHYGTKPVIFLSLTGFAFVITCIGMYRVVKNYMKKLKETEEKDGNK